MQRLFFIFVSMKEQFFDSISKLVEVNIQLFKLETQQEISNLIVRLAIAVIMLIIVNMAVVLGSFAMAFLLGQWLENNFYGFGIVTILYLALGVVAWTNRNLLEKIIRKQVEITMLEKNNKQIEKM